MVVLDAIGADDQIGRLADRDAEAAQQAIIRGRLNGEHRAQHLHHFKLAEIIVHATGVCGVSRSLQDLQQNQITHQKANVEVQRRKFPHWRGVDASEMCDPDGAVDDGHPSD